MDLSLNLCDFFIQGFSYENFGMKLEYSGLVEVKEWKGWVDRRIETVRRVKGGGSSKDSQLVEDGPGTI